MQYFYHVDLVTRNTTKFVSTNLEPKLVHKHFPMYFSSQIIKKNQKCFSYYYWADPWERLAHSRFRPAQPSGGKGDGPARGSGPRPTWPSKAEARRPRHAGVPGAMAVRPLRAGRRPLPAMTGQAGVRAGSARRWRTRAGHSRG